MNKFVLIEICIYRIVFITLFSSTERSSRTAVNFSREACFKKKCKALLLLSDRSLLTKEFCNCTFMSANFWLSNHWKDWIKQPRPLIPSNKKVISLKKKSERRKTQFL